MMYLELATAAENELQRSFALRMTEFMGAVQNKSVLDGR